MKKFAIFASAIACLFASPAQAEIVAQTDAAFVTRDSAVVKADLRETWLALISPGKWWNSAHTFSGDSSNMILTPQGGGCFCERIPAEDTATKVGLGGSVEHMSVILSIPDQALRMRGSLGPLQSEPVQGIMTITLSETGEGTRIVFEYAVAGFMRFKVPVISKAVDGVMSQQLSGLAELLGVVEAPKGAATPDNADATNDDAEPDADPESVEEKADPKDPKISVDEAFGDLSDGD
ncbi:hypothetical protein GCM10023115_14150 [Pontixanthobacter gangjinensis]|uniref:SRPBCC family protein n=1 Tax=Pontixanthobacter gangjinensis TaxID=1028742 RepID=A0A6I4SLQ8_9SPHN|nr:SRPBCC family protein [Pontixanthobacter gangjinensis]MXO56659.1 SRPBCC family protein [Pontixanthobacter gangjinensis]